MTEKIYLSVKQVEANAAKLDFLTDALDIAFEEDDLETRNLYSTPDDRESNTLGGRNDEA